MKVLITANSAWNVWNFRKPIVQELLSQGHHVTVLAPIDDFVQPLIGLGCQFTPLEINSKGTNPFEELKLIQRLRQNFSIISPDIILSYTIKNNIYGAMASNNLDIPFLPNVSGLGTGFLSGGALQFVVERLYRRAFRGLPIVFFQNQDDLDLFVSGGLISAKQGRLLPGSGVDLQYFRAVDMVDKQAPVFLLIARMLKDKGVLEFVEAARRLKATLPQVRFQLMGALGSENRTAIPSEMVEAWVKEGIVEYLGTSQDVRQNIAAATCVVLPSYREGAPRTLIEAAAIGRPVIATDVPGCRSVVDVEVTGYLCEARNANSLASTIRRFLDLSFDQQKLMGLAGRAKAVREFDQAFVVNAYNTAIRELTSQQSST